VKRCGFAKAKAAGRLGLAWPGHIRGCRERAGAEVFVLHNYLKNENQVN
jgi:hypothetical protein